MPVGGRWRRPSRWDVSPAEELSEVRDDLARLYAQVQEQRALIQVQATLLNERTCILGRPLVEMVAGVIILWAVGTEKKKKSGGAFQAFLGWKKKRKVGDLATRVELTRDDLCNKALTCIQGRNGTVHYPTLASLQAGVEEARSVIAAGQAYFTLHVPDQIWCIANFEVIQTIFNFHD